MVKSKNIVKSVIKSEVSNKPKFTSQIIIDCDSKPQNDIDSLYKLFIPEDKNFGRASFDLKKVSKHLIIDINAQDAVSLKIAFNAITKILIVWEKTAELSKES